MRDRILTGWTFQRAIYVILGGFMLVQSSFEGLWIGILFGAYFASMGVFNFGCAAGNCYVPPGRQPYRETSREE